MAEAPGSHHLHIRVERLWAAVAPIHIGEVPASPAMPDEIVFIDDGHTALMRLHIHYPTQEYHLRTEAIAWRDWIVVGFAGRVVLISIRTGTQHTIALSDHRPPDSLDYFCGINCDHDYLLVCSGKRVFRIGEDGNVLWISGELGLDGVIAHQVDSGVIHGSGEWDPPGGWQPFTISLDTGLAVSA